MNDERELKVQACLKIFVRSWHPEGKPRGVVVIVHGFNAHSGMYLWVAEQFVDTSGLRGLRCASIRACRGNSDGDRFYVNSFEDYASDVASVVTLAKSREPGLPVFLLGHSAGGVTSCLYTLEHQWELSGLICEEFLRSSCPRPILCWPFLGQGWSHIAPHAHVLRLKNEDFSRDPNAVKEMNEDPLIDAMRFSSTCASIAAMVRADERLKKEFPLITLPVLILHARLLDKASREFSGSQFFLRHRRVRADKTRCSSLRRRAITTCSTISTGKWLAADIMGWVNAHLSAARSAASVKRPEQVPESPSAIKIHDCGAALMSCLKLLPPAGRQRMKHNTNELVRRLVCYAFERVAASIEKPRERLPRRLVQALFGRT